MTRRLSVLGILCLFWAAAAYADLRDPTRPLLSLEKPGASQVPAWELQAIIISKNRKLAIFNGQTLRLGSEVGGFKVVAITPNTVHLKGPDGKMTLFLNQTVKKSSNKPT